MARARPDPPLRAPPRSGRADMPELPNLRHMRVFLEAARAGSVSVAADRAALSQPAATQAIKRLEAELGAPLLARRAGRFLPTECGALLAARVEAALDHLRNGARAAARGKGPGTGRNDAGFDRRVTAAQLRALVAIAGAGSFTLAARRLGLSQPSVHRTARGLEAAAGITFFRATPAGVSLTAPAESFARGAMLAMAEIRQGTDEIGRALGRERSRFVLGSLPLARTAIVPRATHAMIASRPGVQIRVVDGRYDDLLRALRMGELDAMIGALRDPAPADDVVQERLFDDRLAIVAHPAHPLAGRRGLSFADTLDYPWLAPPATTPAGQYLGDRLRPGADGQSPVRVVSSSLAMLRGMLAAGPYVSIVSRQQIAVEERLGQIVVLDIPLTGDRRPIGLTMRAGWRPTATQAAFLDCLRAAATEAQASAAAPRTGGARSAGDAAS